MELDLRELHGDLNVEALASLGLAARSREVSVVRVTSVANVGKVDEVVALEEVSIVTNNTDSNTFDLLGLSTSSAELTVTNPGNITNVGNMSHVLNAHSMNGGAELNGKSFHSLGLTTSTSEDGISLVPFITDILDVSEDFELRMNHFE